MWMLFNGDNKTIILSSVQNSNVSVTADTWDMNTRLTRKNRSLYNELVESKPINVISNGGARKEVEELYKRNYYTLLYSLQVWKYSNKYKDTNRYSYKILEKYWE